MNRIFVVGIDPGFASCGVTVAELLAETELVYLMDVITTEKSSKKRSVRASEDNVTRAIKIFNDLHNLIPRKTIAFCAEAQSWPRNASASAKVGIAWGVICAVAEDLGIPILQATPKEIKKCVCGKGTASKLEVQEALVQRYGSLPLPKQKGKREHVCDALGAIVTCLDAPAIMMARRLIA